MPHRPTPRREHSARTKYRLVGHVLARQTIAEAAAAEHIPYDTARKIIRRNRETGNTENLPRSGRLPKTTARDGRHIIQNARKHRRKPLQELANESASNISPTTVRRVLHRHNYHRCIAMTKPLLLEHQIMARFAWAKYRKHHGTIDFETTIYSDECYICLDDKHQRIYVTRLPEEKFIKDCIVPAFKQSSVRVMVWACIISGRKGPLVVLDYPGGQGGGIYRTVLPSRCTVNMARRDCRTCGKRWWPDASTGRLVSFAFRHVSQDRSLSLLDLSAHWVHSSPYATIDPRRGFTGERVWGLEDEARVGDGFWT